jgi:hypothetical protein
VRLDALLVEAHARPKRERLSYVRLFKGLREEGCAGGYNSVGRCAGRWTAGRSAGALAAAAWLCGCAAVPSKAPDAARALRGTDRLCTLRAQPVQAARLEAHLTPEAFDAAADRLAAQGWSRTAVEVAEVIGALGPLQRLSEPEGAGPARGTGAELRRLRLRQAIGDRITAAMLDVSAALAEIDCEGERGDQIKNRLQAIETRRAWRLSLGSILAGALTAGVTGGLGLVGVPGADIAAIAGGAAEGSLGASVLFGEASGTLRTEPNLLREVWERPARSALFPETVWRYLNRPIPGQGGGPATIAEAVVAEWRAGDRFGPPGSAEERARTALLFGPGGTYTVEDLDVRESLLELLETSVALMNRDLRALLAELQAHSPAAP